MATLKFTQKTIENILKAVVACGELATQIETGYPKKYGYDLTDKKELARLAKDLCQANGNYIDNYKTYSNTDKRFRNYEDFQSDSPYAIFKALQELESRTTSTLATESACNLLQAMRLLMAIRIVENSAEYKSVLWGR